MNRFAILLISIVGIVPVVRGEQSPSSGTRGVTHPALSYLATQSSR